MREIEPQQKAAMSRGKSPLPAEKKARHHRWDIAAFPVELSEKILSYQSVRDVSLCRLVSRSWKRLIDGFHLPARSFYRSCYPDVPFPHGQEIVDRDYRAACRWLRQVTRVGCYSVEQLDQLRSSAAPYFCQELCRAIGAGLAQTKFDQPRLIYTTKHPHQLRNFNLSARGHCIASISCQYLDPDACATTISIHGNIHGQWQQQKRVVEPGYVHCFGFSPDENDFVAVIHHSGAMIDYHCVLVWHFGNGDWQEHLQMTYDAEASVAMASFTPCGQYLVIAAASLEIYHRADTRWQRQDSIPQVAFADNLAFSADKRHFLVTYFKHTFRLCHRVGGQWRAQGVVGGCDQNTRPVFSPDGCYFAVIHRGSVTIWTYENESWKPQRRIEGSGGVRRLNFYSKSRFVISYWNASPEIGELAGGEQDSRLVFPCHAVTNIRISPDHQHFAWYEHNRVRIWALVSGLLWERGKIEHSDAVLDICFSPDGELLATACADKTAKVVRRIGAIWREQQSIAHPSNVCRVRCSPAGDYLLTTGTDGSVNLWGVAGLGSAP